MGSHPEPETMEEKVTSAISRREREVQEAEAASAAAERSLSQLQTSFNIAKKTLKEKSEELSKLEKQLREGLEDSGKGTVEEAIKEAETEIKIVRDHMNSKEQTTSFWQQILDRAQSTHKCMACDRDIQEKEIKAIEAYVGRSETHQTDRRCNAESTARSGAATLKSSRRTRLNGCRSCRRGGAWRLSPRLLRS